MISPDQFWDRLQESGLLSATRLDSIRSRIATKPKIASSARSIANALVANGVLTEEQATVMLRLDTEGVSLISEPAIPEVDLKIALPTVNTKQRATWVVFLLVGTLACIVGLATIVYFGFPSTSETHSTPDPSPNAATEDSSTEDSPASYHLTDSEDALWARPNPGNPVDFPRLPAGTQMVIQIRMADLHSSSHGDKIIRSLGQDLEKRLNDWTAKLNLQRSELDRLTLYFLPQGTTMPIVVLHGELQVDCQSKFGGLGTLDTQRVIKLAASGIWCPESLPSHFYYGPWELIRTLPTAAPGRLRRELEQLRGQSHTTDLVTILANPNFLQDEAQGLFPDTRKRLLEGLFAFWSDQAQAVALGFQHEELAFLEVRMIAREDMPARVLATRARGFLQSLPRQARDFLGTAPLDPYWQPLAIRFPEMIAFVIDQTRIQVEGREVALNTIAPVEATHNLLLASELSLATPTGQATEDSVVDDVVEDSELTIDDVLASKTTVRFAQKSLDEAAQDIAGQIQEERSGLSFKLRIQIDGGALEPEGITRNQQIRNFHAAEVSLAEILTSLVMKANPDQSIASASDPKQKLVWIASASDLGLIEITTREAVTVQGRDLPASFR